jgi:hypothetical protein
MFVQQDYLKADLKDLKGDIKHRLTRTGPSIAFPSHHPRSSLVSASLGLESLGSGDG